MEKRVYNFSPGPAVLPLPVLQEAQRDLLALPGHGHLDPGNQPPLEGLRQDHQSGRGQPSHPAEDSRQLPRAVHARRGDPPVRHGPHEPVARHAASRPTTSSPAPGAKRPAKKPRRKAPCSVAWDGKAGNFNRVPKQSESNLDPNAAYIYFCANETIQGVQYPNTPDVGRLAA